MQEIISCPSCHRKLQVPESLLGQDVQCPTCGATFIGTASGASADTEAPPSVRPASSHPAPAARTPREGADYRGRHAEDYDEDYRYRRRPRRDVVPHRGSTVLVLGILSLVVCAPILGPIAWSMGHTDLNEIRAGRMDPEGEGITNAGKICGMIGTILGIVSIVFVILWFVLAAAVLSHR
jgi:hypothetical protein